MILAIDFFTVGIHGVGVKGEEAAVKTWEKTRVQNLMRHKSGRYYARLYLGGKEVWKPLETAHFSVAEARMAAARKEIREQRGRNVDTASAKMTFGDAAKLHLQHVDADSRLKRRTRAYCHEVDVSLRKTWPDLAITEVRRLTPAMCKDWALRYAKAMSPTRFNGALSYFRHVLKVAIENDVLHTDPTLAIKRMPVRGKELELPTRAQFTAFISEMRNGHSRDSNNCADLVQGLAYTGCRISEASQIEWRDVDFANGEILVRGDPQERTKNGEVRRVPMIAEARELFSAMRQSRADESGTAKVFLVRESQNAINRSAKAVGMKRITHHDLRHFFATVSIESGVDIPTVSRWLGHKDGGALAMRTYGHLRREHSIAQAQKVSFAPAAADSATCFAAKVAPRPTGKPKGPKATSSRAKAPKAESGTAKLADERSKTSAKRLPTEDRGSVSRSSS